MTGLGRWLRQQIDVDEQVADLVDAVGPDLAEPPSGPTEEMMFLAPEQYVNLTGVLSGDRIRAEVAAKRRMLARHADCGTGTGYCDGAGHGLRLGDGTPACPDLLDVAASYDYRRGYRGEWRLFARPG